MFVEKHWPSGTIEIVSSTDDGYLFRRRYIGYTVREAKSIFRAALRAANKGE